MKYLLPLLILLSLNVQAGDFYIEMGVGNNAGHQWQDRGEAGTSIGAGYTAKFTDTLSYDCGYIHFSQIAAVPPYDEGYESTLDHVGCKIRWIL